MKLKQRLKIKQAIAAVALPLAVGTLAAFITKDGMAMFRTVLSPPLSPPAWLFPVVWSCLYVLMGLASYFVWIAPVSPIRRDRALSFYVFNLAANFIWPLFFFGMELYLLAFFWLILLWLLAGLSTLLFWYIEPRSGRLMLPYMLWLSFALYLNFGVWLLNR